MKIFRLYIPLQPPADTSHGPVCHFMPLLALPAVSSCPWKHSFSQKNNLCIVSPYPQIDLRLPHSLGSVRVCPARFIVR